MRWTGLPDASIDQRGKNVPKCYAAPIGAFFGPELRAFTGFGVRFLQPSPESLVTVKCYSNTKMAVNGGHAGTKKGHNWSETKKITSTSTERQKRSQNFFFFSTSTGNDFWEFSGIF